MSMLAGIFIYSTYRYVSNFFHIQYWYLYSYFISCHIRSYDPRDVTSESRKSVEKLLRDRADSFQPAVAKRASTAAAPLAAWVKTNVRFSYVLEKVKPLEQEQNKLQR